MSSNSTYIAESNGAGLAVQPVRMRRLVDRLAHYWRDIAGNGGFPSVDDIDPWMIGDDLKDCLLIEVKTPLKSSCLLAVGEHLLAEPHRQLRLYTIADVPAHSLVSMIVSRLQWVQSSRDCIVAEGETGHDGGTILYRCTLLPLAADGAAIDHVLAAVTYKFVEPARQPVAG